MATIFLATDHAGFEHKEKLKAFLESHQYHVVDCGAFVLDPNDDYPDFILPAAQNVAEGRGRAIIFGSSGQGEAIVANRMKGVRAIVYAQHNPEIIKLGREHNDANVLSIGARFVSIEETLQAVTLFLDTHYTGEDRHDRRIKKIDTVY